jgi:hypothetical protein
MANKSDKRSVRHSWFRWLPRILFIIVALMPFIYEIIHHIVLPGYLFWNWVGEIFYSIPFIIVAIVAWVAPIIAGVLALIAVPLGFFYIVFMSAWMHQSPNWVFQLFFLFACLFLVTGGILSIIWGVQRRRWRHSQVQMNMDADSK